MNRIEHLLTIFSEECAECIQDTSKALRFGVLQGKEDKATGFRSNVERLREEWNQLIAMKQMLEAEGIDLGVDLDVRSAKKKKVERYLKKSKELGTLTE